jgi:thioredoxin family protein
MSGWVGVAIATIVLSLATAGGLALRSSQGRFRPSAPSPMTPYEVLRALGVDAGIAVTLVQFSSVYCAPCVTARALCADVARTVPGIRHLDIDAELHLDEVRALDIWRTPTVLVVDDRGHVRARATGAPTRAQLVAAVTAVLPASSTFIATPNTPAVRVDRTG